MSEEIRGLAIPFCIDPETGSVVQASGYDKLKQSLTHVLLTGAGERMMRRSYGAGLRQLLHDPNNDALRALVKHQIGRAITRWEPRVQVQNVTVSQQDGELYAEISYVERRTRQPQRLSVPIGLGDV
jgi:phage baseplate assembly protein W